MSPDNLPARYWVLSPVRYYPQTMTIPGTYDSAAGVYWGPDAQGMAALEGPFKSMEDLQVVAQATIAKLRAKGKRSKIPLWAMLVVDGVITKAKGVL